MNLEQWQQLQLEVSPEDINLGLTDIKAVAKRLKLDKIKPKLVTVAGTNGKGSTVAMLAQILTQLNISTGVYTSPHFVNYQERIKICGSPIDENLLCEYFSKIKSHLADNKLSYFEYGTLAAIMAFVEAKVEVIILEVGLGGRFDATNAWDSDVAILTNVSLDHQSWLGDNIEAIGREKAGIFRASKPTIIGEPKPPQSVLNYLQAIKAKHLKFNIKSSNKTWEFSNNRQSFKDLVFPNIPGEFQLNNAACAISAAIEIAPNKVTKAIINSALTKVQLTGRLQTIKHKQRNFLVDVAHNREAVNHLKQYLSSQKCSAIFGVMKDKDIKGIIEIINPNVKKWHIFDLQHERAETCQQLELKLLEYHPFVTVHSSIYQAIDAATQDDELICVFGSFITVAHFLKVIQNEKH